MLKRAILLTAVLAVSQAFAANNHPDCSSRLVRKVLNDIMKNPTITDQQRQVLWNELQRHEHVDNVASGSLMMGARPGLLEERAERIQLREAIHPAKDSEAAFNELQSLNLRMMSGIKLRAEEGLRELRPAVGSSLAQAGDLMPVTPGGAMIAMVHQDALRLQNYADLLDSPVPAAYTNSLREIETVIAEINAIGARNGVDYPRASIFINRLSAATAKIFMKAYGIKTLGHNPETQQLEADLAANKLSKLMRNLNLISVLRNNTFLGSALAMQDGFGTPVKTLHMAMFGTSGHWSGSPTDLQTGIMGLVLDQALRRWEYGTNPGDEVMFLKWDDTVHGTAFVESPKDAEALLNNLDGFFQNTRSGTNLTASLNAAIDQAISTHKADPSIKAMNLTLVLYGNYELKAESLRGQLRKLPPGVEFNLNLVSIVDDRPETAIEISREFGNAGARFRNIQITTEAGNKLLSDAQIAPTPDKLATTDLVDLTSDEAKAFAGRLVRAGRALDTVIKPTSVSRTPEQWNEYVSNLHWKPSSPTERREPTLARVELTRLRGYLMRSRSGLTKSTLAALLDDLMTHFQELTGVTLDGMDVYEYATLQHLIREIIEYSATATP